jgi:hypothetical protein
MAFRGCEFEDDCDQLASTELPNLLRLDLSGSGDFGITEESVLKVVSSSGFPNLQSLCLQSLHLTDDVLQTLANNLSMAELREVDFRHNIASQEAIGALLDSEQLPSLSRIILSPGDVSSELKERFGNRVWMVN